MTPAFGFLAPVNGARLSAVIDVAVIRNALQALRVEPGQASSAGRRDDVDQGAALN